MTVDELLARVVEAAGSDNPATIAFVFNLGGYDAPRRVRRWLQGVSKPGAEETLLILTRLGLLSSESDAPDRPASGQDFLRHRRLDAENATRTAAILEEHERYLEELEGRLEASERRHEAFEQLLDAVSARLAAVEQGPQPSRRRQVRQG